MWRASTIYALGFAVLLLSTLFSHVLKFLSRGFLQLGRVESHSLWEEFAAQGSPFWICWGLRCQPGSHNFTMDGMDVESMSKKVSGLVVNLVNPRFVNFNRPFLLAVLVTLGAVGCFLPLFVWYLVDEKKVEIDNSVYEEVMITGNELELEKVLREYVLLPSKCTAGGKSNHSYLVGEGEQLSQDGLTRTVRSCSYDTCILATYQLDSYIDIIDEYSGSGSVYARSCLIAKEWRNGELQSLFHHPVVNTAGLTSDKCRSGGWCTIQQEAELADLYAGCCPDGAACTSGPESSLWTPDLCKRATDTHQFYQDLIDLQETPTLYKICPREKYLYEGGDTGGSCALGSKQGTYNFKVGWTRNETAVTYTKSNTQTAFSNALALTAYIEIVVTILLILLLRALGCIKEVKQFSWGEIVNEQLDAKQAEAEMQERMQANIRAEIKAEIMAEIKGKTEEQLRGTAQDFDIPNKLEEPWEMFHCKLPPGPTMPQKKGPISSSESSFAGQDQASERQVVFIGRWDSLGHFVSFHCGVPKETRLDCQEGFLWRACLASKRISGCCSKWSTRLMKITCLVCESMWTVYIQFRFNHRYWYSIILGAGCSLENPTSCCFTGSSRHDQPCLFCADSFCKPFRFWSRVGAWCWSTYRWKFHFDKDRSDEKMASYWAPFGGLKPGSFMRPNCLQSWLLKPSWKLGRRERCRGKRIVVDANIKKLINSWCSMCRWQGLTNLSTSFQKIPQLSGREKRASSLFSTDAQYEGNFFTTCSVMVLTKYLRRWWRLVVGPRATFLQ